MITSCFCIVRQYGMVSKKGSQALVLTDSENLTSVESHPKLSSVKSLGKTAGRGAFNSAQSHQRAERVGRKPVLVSLALEVAQQRGDFALGDFAGHRHVNIRSAEVAVVFWNFVLEHEMTPERVPGEIRQHAMILVSIVAKMRQDEIGFELAPGLFERGFD